jgi:hypothetical protein
MMTNKKRSAGTMKPTMMVRNILASLAGVLLLAALLRFALADSAVAQPSGEPYRVELVGNDQYKVQTALNSMAKRGWFYISSVPRNDGKVLLVFRKAQ